MANDFNQLYYNGAVFFSDDKVLLVKESYGGSDILKLPGGMQESIDYNLFIWIEKFKELLTLAGFSSKEVDFLAQQESLINRSTNVRSLIRKFLMETGIYASSFEHVFYTKDIFKDEKKMIHKNFFFIKAYFQAENVKIIESQDVRKPVFFYPDEVLGMHNLGNQIFIKHKKPLEEALGLEIESQKLNIESLSEFNWE